MNDDYAPGRKRFRNHVFVWDKKFETRQRQAYRTEDNSLIQESDETAVTAFLNEQRSRLDPPTYNYTALQMFLEQVRDEDLFRELPLPQDARPVALLDERRDDTGWLDIVGDHHAARDWEGYVNYPPKGRIRPAELLNACELYRRLQTSRQLTGAERRIIYLANISPLAALAIASCSPSLQAPILRDFLQRYVSHRVYFGVRMAFGFALEFHLPYFALRESLAPRTDIRRLRRSTGFSSTVRPGQTPEQLHEAQISVLVTGVDEWFWTTYCCVDTYFGSEETIEFYHERGYDAPTGGLKPADFPEWNPRQYFLLVLSRRFRQVTKEWANVVYTLEGRLHYHTKSLFSDLGQRTALVDDPDLTRTYEYTWTVQLLRVLNDTLVRLIDSWENFEEGELRYFDVEEQRTLHTMWNKYLAEIEKDLTELRYLRHSLQQMLAHFNNMRDNLVSASSMVETRIASLQGLENKTIARLTRVAVVYLPLSLGTAAFSMAMIPDRGSWLAYILVLLVLLGLTFAIAFRSQVLQDAWEHIREGLWNIYNRFGNIKAQSV